MGSAVRIRHYPVTVSVENFDIQFKATGAETLGR